MYPTKEEILEKPFVFTEKTLKTANKWKKKYKKGLKNKAINIKFSEISELLRQLVKPEKIKIQIRETYRYDSEKKIIYLERNNPSVISALHELGHHLYGSSELEACRFSVWLFKTIFPEFYEKLFWVGHLLVKKQKT